MQRKLLRRKIILQHMGAHFTIQSNTIPYITYTIFSQVRPQLQESGTALSPCEVESLLRQLTNPDEGNEMHVRCFVL